MKKRRFPLSFAILLPTMLVVLVVQGVSYFLAYMSVRHADYESSCALDKEFLQRTSIAISWSGGPAKVLEMVKETYEANPRESLPTDPTELAEYRKLFSPIMQTPEFATLQNNFVFNRSSAVQDYADLGFFDEVRNRFVVIWSVGDGSMYNPATIGTFWSVDPADFSQSMFLGKHYYDGLRNEGGFFTSGISSGRAQKSSWWLLSETNYEDIYEESQHFLKHFSYAAVATLVAMTLASFLFIHFGLIRPIKRLSSASDSYVVAMHEGEPKQIFALDAHKHTNELLALNDSLYFMQESIGDYAATLKEATEREQRAAAELALAERIQSSMVPSKPLRENGAQIYGTMKPAKEVGGDFYNYFSIDETHVGFFVADVSGKGVPAALFMARAASISRFLLADMHLNKINDALCDENAENLFVTGFFGVYNSKTRQLDFVNCGHETVFIRHNGVYAPLNEENNLPLGLLPGFDYVHQKLTLAEGDSLFLYTDGLSEAMNENGDLFGHERILATLNEHPLLNGQSLILAMQQKMAEFVGDAEQSDDACFVNFLASPGSCLEFEPNEEGLASVSGFIDESLSHMDPSLMATIQVVIDDLASNVVFYSGAKSASLSLTTEKDTVIGILVDDGKPFDPLGELPDRDPDAPGGLGIAIAKSMSEQIAYTYAEGHNILSFVIKKKNAA